MDKVYQPVEKFVKQDIVDARVGNRCSHTYLYLSLLPNLSNSLSSVRMYVLWAGPTLAPESEGEHERGAGGGGSSGSAIEERPRQSQTRPHDHPPGSLLFASLHLSTRIIGYPRCSLYLFHSCLLRSKVYRVVECDELAQTHAQYAQSRQKFSKRLQEALDRLQVPRYFQRFNRLQLGTPSPPYTTYGLPWRNERQDVSAKREFEVMDALTHFVHSHTSLWADGAEYLKVYLCTSLAPYYGHHRRRMLTTMYLSHAPLLYVACRRSTPLWRISRRR